MNATPQTPQSSLKLDAGIAPLVARLGFVPHFRLYVILQELNRADGNRQRVTVERLYAALGALGVEYQPQRYNQLITAGRGIFWNVGQGRRLYLVSWVNVWRGLLERLEELGAPAAELGKYRPAQRQVYVDIAGGLQAFTARLYAAWVGSRRTGMVTASRDAQGRVWGTSGRTIYTYARLGGVTVTPGYVQYEGPIGDVPHDAGGDDIRGDVRAYRAGKGIRYSWQAPNTYGYLNHEHDARGQQRKIGRATRRDDRRDAELRAASKRIFDAGADVVKAWKQAQRHARKYGPKWQLIGLGDVHTRGRVTRYYEALNPRRDYPVTNAGESLQRSLFDRGLKIFQHSTGRDAQGRTHTRNGTRPRLQRVRQWGSVGASPGRATATPPRSSAALGDVVPDAAAVALERLRRGVFDVLERLLNAAALDGSSAERRRREVQAANEARLVDLWHGYRAALVGLGG